MTNFCKTGAVKSLVFEMAVNFFWCLNPYQAAILLLDAKDSLTFYGEVFTKRDEIVQEIARRFCPNQLCLHSQGCQDCLLQLALALTTSGDSVFFAWVSWKVGVQTIHVRTSSKPLAGSKSNFTGNFPSLGNYPFTLMLGQEVCGTRAV